MATGEMTKPQQAAKPPANQQKQELTPFQRKLVGMRDFLTRQAPQMQIVLQKFTTPDEVTRFALNAMYRNPKLLECSPESVGMALMKAGQMGIKPDGYHGHLIPFWNSKANCNECQFQPDYKGLIALAHRNPKVKSFQAGAVRQGDFFDFQQGSEPYLHYKKSLGERGDLIAAWAMVEMDGGGESFVVLNSAEIAKAKAVSQGAKQQDSIWDKWPDAMWAKTAVKALSKFVPLGPEFIEAVQADNDQERGRKTIDINDFSRISEVAAPEGYTDEETGGNQTPKNIPQTVSAQDLTNPIPPANNTTPAKEPAKQPSKPQQQKPPAEEAKQEPPKQPEAPSKATPPKPGPQSTKQKMIATVMQCASESQLEFQTEQVGEALEIREISKVEHDEVMAAIQLRYQQINGDAPSGGDGNLFSQPGAGNYS